MDLKEILKKYSVENPALAEELEAYYGSIHLPMVAVIVMLDKLGGRVAITVDEAQAALTRASELKSAIQDDGTVILRLEKR